MALALTTLAVAAGWGEDLTLDQAVALALDHGPDNTTATATLLAAKATDAQAQARAGFSVTSSLGYSAAKTQNTTTQTFDPAKVTAVSPYSATATSKYDNLLPQQATGTVSLASPTTSISATGAETFQTDPDGKLLTATSINGTLSQTLLSGYWGGATQAAADKSSLTYQTAQLNALAARYKAALNVKNAFFALLAAQDRADIYNQTLGQRRDALRFTQAKAESGTATAYDLKVAQAAVRSAELDLATGKSALVTAQARLANLLGTTLTSAPRALATDLPAPAATADEAVAAALKNRVELQTSALTVRSSAIDASLASGAIVPTVTLTGGVTYTAADVLPTGTATALPTIQGTVGIKITPPSVDGGLADNQGLAARTQQTIAQTQLDLLRKSIPVDVTDAWYTWSVNGQRLDLAKVQVDNADINRQIVKSQFDSGAKLFSDWLTAEVAYSTAQLNVVNARLTYQQSAATLQNLMGL
jgi:outer membrane protein TolC